MKTKQTYKKKELKSTKEYNRRNTGYMSKNKSCDKIVKFCKRNEKYYENITRKIFQI